MASPQRNYDNGNGPNWLTFINTALLLAILAYVQSVEKRIATMEANNLILMQERQQQYYGQKGR